MILVGFKNLAIHNCQVYESGAHGIFASLRLSQNIDIANCQIFNCADAALRVDNVENLTIRDCEFTNYVATQAPVVKIQDIFQGTIARCQINSVAGTSDGLFVRNCRGITVLNSNAHIVCNQSASTCPIGFNFKGNVTGTTVRQCTVTGTPAIGIALQQDTLNGTDTGVIIENCLVQGAAQQGILCALATNCGIYSSKIIGCQSDGIRLDAQTSQCSVRDNTLISNGGYGISNLNGSGHNTIYHNFAQNNALGNYNGVAAVLITPPAAHVGVLENIDN